ncbi:hypothetical protein PaelaDRAFT_3950 [Paenibacillus lactis 154]|uniref:Uncharacterized protein n=1 Tax=Paenibacillus lactis 154 TaxID=743719 RepID=G4HIY9_9BACL|nr:hypothetical protein PaelaDRAFT_3950 [Paenibacillus lactis 154]
MTLKKPWKIIAFGIIGIIFLVVIFIGLYINNIGFHNLKLMYTLSTTEKLIVPMDKVGHYLAREDRSVELLKERMSSRGWSYVEQEGSNYFFEKGNEKAIVTLQQWNHKYIIYQVKDNVINIAD